MFFFNLRPTKVLITVPIRLGHSVAKEIKM